jgi:hypothetical protein
VRRRYEVWETEDGAVLFASDQSAAQKANLAQKLVRKLVDLEANTFEEALAVYHVRMGWEPFKPVGEPRSCPKCGAFFYPEGSGECWRCGKIV